MATTDELGACSKVHLSLHVPRGRTRPMQKLLQPLLRAADPALSLTHVHESQSPVWASALRARRDVPAYSVGGGGGGGGDDDLLTTPALSLVVFLCEGEELDAARHRLRRFPWKFHHRIELHSGVGGGGTQGPSGSFSSFSSSSSTSSRRVSGTQEFFSLSRQYPLCCVSPAPSDQTSVVRFNLFVRNYRAMLEFYRLLADSEMESTKADFALFTVNTSDSGFSSFFASSSYSSSSTSPFSSLSSSSSSTASSSSSSSSSSRRRRKRTSSAASSSAAPGLACSVQLALKLCPHLDPYPLTSAYLTFFVRNMTALRTVLPGKAVQTSANTFTVRDPDGNCVIVHDVEPAFAPKPDRPLRQPGGSGGGGDRRLTTRPGRSRNDRGRAAHPVYVSHHHPQKTKARYHYYCESQDSGRFSDSEQASSELDQCLERLVKEVSLHVTDRSQSSDTDTDTDPGGDPRPGLDDSGCLTAVESGPTGSHRTVRSAGVCSQGEVNSGQRGQCTMGSTAVSSHGVENSGQGGQCNVRSVRVSSHGVANSGQIGQCSAEVSSHGVENRDQGGHCNGRSVRVSSHGAANSGQIGQCSVGVSSHGVANSGQIGQCSAEVSFYGVENRGQGGQCTVPSAEVSSNMDSGHSGDSFFGVCSCSTGGRCDQCTISYVDVSAHVAVNSGHHGASVERGCPCPTESAGRHITRVEMSPPEKGRNGVRGDSGSSRHNGTSAERGLSGRTKNADRHIDRLKLAYSDGFRGNNCDSARPFSLGDWDDGRCAGSLTGTSYDTVAESDQCGSRLTREFCDQDGLCSLTGTSHDTVAGCDTWNSRLTMGFWDHDGLCSARGSSTGDCSHTAEGPGPGLDRWSGLNVQIGELASIQHTPAKKTVYL